MMRLDPVALASQLAGSLPPDLRLGAARVVSLTPGRRAVVAYSTEHTGRPGPELIAKVYADPVRAARLYALLRALPGVPRAVAHVPAAGACVYEASTGRTLDQLPAPDQPAAVASAAGWLAALHAADLRLDRRLDPVHELDGAAAWGDLVATAVPGSAGPARELVARLRSGLRRAVAAGASGPLRPIHKDFQYQHTLFEPGRVVVIDLDEMRAGDPAFDVAHFAANLRLLRKRGGPALEDAFVAAYGAPPPGERHRFWLSYTFLKLAKQLVRGRGPSPAPTGAEREREVAWALAEGLR